MQHSTKRRVVLSMTTGGLLLGGIGMGVAQAASSADGSATDSPGLLSGNLIQVPINTPVNVCGNSISVVGILDTATGDTCANSGSNSATANGSAKGSPGVGSGNLIQLPINAPVNVCGNSVSGVGIGDSAVDNHCSNGAGGGSDGTTATGGSHDSPGIGSGNTVQLPINAPVNLCGNQVSGVGVGDTAAGNTCSNGGPAQPTPPCGCQPPPVSTTPPGNPPAPTCGCKPPAPSTPPRIHGRHSRPAGRTPGTSLKPVSSLAETGSGAGQVLAPFGASTLAGGGLLLRKRLNGLRHLGHRGN